MFLLNPENQQACPVIFSYLLNQPLFERLGRLPTLAHHLRRLHIAPLAEKQNGLDYVWQDDDFLSKWPAETFQEYWKDESNRLGNDFITETARGTIGATAEDCSSIGLQQIYYWPAIYILESIVRPHNEFLRTLQKHSTAHFSTIRDLDVTPKDIIDVKKFNATLINCVLQSVTDEGIIFTSFTEKQFIREFSKISHSFVLLYSLSYHSFSFFSPFLYNLVPYYKSLFTVYDLSAKQKKAINFVVKGINQNGVIENPRVSNVLILLESLMRNRLPQDTTSTVNDDPIVPLLDYLKNYQETQKGEVDVLASRALIDSNTKADDIFRVGHIASIYQFLENDRSEIYDARA